MSVLGAAMLLCDFKIFKSTDLLRYVLRVLIY